MKTNLIKSKLLSAQSFLRTFAITILFLAFFIFSLYLLINSPA
jgi:hypothetical protein